MIIAGEQVLVEAFVTQPAVEAFHEAVLHRLARCDVVPFDLVPCTTPGLPEAPTSEKKEPS